MVAEPTPYRWDVASYLALVTAGIIDEDERVELLDGEIIQMAPIGNPHQAAVDILNRTFVTVLGERAIVRVQGSFVLSRVSMPQPDVLLLAPRRDFYRHGSPAPDDVLLVVEVSDSSLHYDLSRKVPAYAAGGVAEAWVINLPEGRIEIFGSPGRQGYQHQRAAHPGESVSPSAFPDLVVSVEDVVGTA